eukprot:985811-Pyramimonas_sp.AAC.1
MTKPTENHIKVALVRLHKNLEHPGTDTLVRVLRDGGACEKAMELAKQLVCDVCNQHVKPKVLQPAALSKDPPPVPTLSIDVKHLPGWIGGLVTAKSLNIVDVGSELQQVEP